jgi:hypothetical protein
MRTDGTHSMVVHRGRLAAIGLTIAATRLASPIPQAIAGPGDGLCRWTGQCGRVHNQSDVRIPVSNDSPPRGKALTQSGQASDPNREKTPMPSWAMRGAWRATASMVTSAPRIVASGGISGSPWGVMATQKCCRVPVPAVRLGRPQALNRKPRPAGQVCCWGAATSGGAKPLLTHGFSRLQTRQTSKEHIMSYLTKLMQSSHVMTLAVCGAILATMPVETAFAKATDPSTYQDSWVSISN